MLLFFYFGSQKTVTQTGEKSVIVRMCVAVKRKLLLFYWKNGTFHSWNGMEEISMPDTPKALAWIKDTICVGFKGDSVYMLYHVSINTSINLYYEPLAFSHLLVLIVS